MAIMATRLPGATEFVHEEHLIAACKLGSRQRQANMRQPLVFFSLCSPIMLCLRMLGSHCMSYLVSTFGAQEPSNMMNYLVWSGPWSKG